MQNEPLISIITPVYNSEKYINRCLDSLIHQTYRNIEIIIINDGSKDFSLNICQEYSKKDQRIVLFTQDNKGVSSARNLGLSKAKGEWIYFVDSDDWLDVNGIEGAVNMINSFPKAEIIRCFNRKVHDYQTNLRAEKYQDVILLTRDELFSKDLMGGYISSLLIKNEVIINNNLRFSEDLTIKEDLEFTFRCVLSCDFILIYNRIFYNYFINTLASFGAKPYNKALNHLKVGEKIYQYGKAYLHNRAIKRFIFIQLNNGLFEFLSALDSKEKLVGKAISSKDVRKDILRYKKKNQFSIKKMKFKNIVFFIAAIIDYTLITYVYAVKRFIHK